MTPSHIGRSNRLDLEHEEVGIVARKVQQLFYRPQQASDIASHEGHLTGSVAWFERTCTKVLVQALNGTKVDFSPDKCGAFTSVKDRGRSQWTIRYDRST